MWFYKHAIIYSVIYEVISSKKRQIFSHVKRRPKILPLSVEQHVVHVVSADQRVSLAVWSCT